MVANPVRFVCYSHCKFAEHAKRYSCFSCFVLAPLNSNVRGYLFSRYSLLYVARWAYQHVKISVFYLVPRTQRNFMTREIFCLYGYGSKPKVINANCIPQPVKRYRLQNWELSTAVKWQVEETIIVRNWFIARHLQEKQVQCIV